MKFYCLILCLLVLMSCQTRKSNKGVVEFDLGQETEIATSKVYPESSEGVHEATRLVGLTLAPALYNSFLYLPIFQAMEKSDIRAHVVSANGFAAVIGALYADSEDFSALEWETFKLHKLLGDSEVFTKDWFSRIETFLRAHFKGKRLFELKSLLIIPYNERGKLKFKDESKVVDAVMESLRNRGKSSFYIHPKFSETLFKQASFCDACVFVSAIAPRIHMKNNSRSHFAFYTKAAGALGKIEALYRLEPDLMMDQTYPLDIIFGDYSSQIERLSAQIIRKVKAKGRNFENPI